MAKKKKITPEELLDIFKGYIPEVKRQIAKKMPGLITEQTRNSDGIWNTTWQCGSCGCENFSNQHLTRYSTYEETCEHCGAVSCHYEYKNHCEDSPRCCQKRLTLLLKRMTIHIVILEAFVLLAISQKKKRCGKSETVFWNTWRKYLIC